MMTECGVCGKRIVIPDPRFYVYKRGDVFFCDQNCMIVYKTKLTREQNGFRPTERKEEDMNHKLTKEIKKRAVEIAVEGGDFLGYLKKNGAKNPSAAWWYIKATLEKADPEKYLELLQVLAANKPVVEIAEKIPPDEVAEVPEENLLTGIESVCVEGKVTLPKKTSKQEIYKALGVPEEAVQVMKITEKPEEKEEKGVVEDRITAWFTPKEEKPKLEYEIMAIKTDLGDFQKDKRDGLVYWTTEEGDKVCLTRMEWFKLAETIPEMMNVLGGV